MSQVEEVARRAHLRREAPRIADPGGAGWPTEPKVTDAERLLYGEFAEIVRRLGEAAVAASHAYSFACKRDQDRPPVPAKSESDPATQEDEAAYRETIQATFQLYENARAVHREIAQKAVALTRKWSGEFVGNTFHPDVSVPG